MIEIALGRRSTDIAVLEIGLDRFESSLWGPAVACPSRRSQRHDIAWHEVQLWCAGGSDRDVINTNPAETSRGTAGDALRRIAGPSRRPGEGKRH